MLNLIVNERSLRGKGQKLLDATEARLKEAQREYRVYRSERKGAVKAFARSLSEAGEREIVAFGGDGTLNEVLNGIVDPANCVLGLIPAGTGNDFAEAAKIPCDVRAVDLMIEGAPRFTDYIQFDDGKRSLNIAGLGIDVDILERCERKKHGGRRSKYFFSLLAALVKYRGLRLSVTVNGKTEEYHALIAAVCNGSQFGGGIPFCPPAVIDDGKMNLVVIDFPKRRQIPFELMRLMRGKLLPRPIAHQVLCEEAVILPEEAGSAQYDGEIMPCEKLAARIVSGKLKMYRG